MLFRNLRYMTLCYITHHIINTKYKCKDKDNVYMYFMHINLIPLFEKKTLKCGFHELLAHAIVSCMLKHTLFDHWSDLN